MKYGGSVPTALYENVASGHQSNVWSSIVTYNSGGRGSCCSPNAIADTDRMSPYQNQDITTNNVYMHSSFDTNSAGNLAHAAMPNNDMPNHDDLVSNINTLSKDIEDILTKTPNVKNQIGLALFDVNGLYMLEAFNIDSSWKSIKDEAIRKEGKKVASNDENVFEYKPEKAVSGVIAVLGSDFKEECVYEDNQTAILKLSSSKYFGEAVVFKNKVIHLNIIRKKI